MTENTTAQGSASKATEEAPKLTAQQLEEMFNALPEETRKTLNNLNALIDEHNAKVDAVKAADNQDPKLIKAEILEQNPKGNAKLKKIWDRIQSLQDQIEKLRSEAYKVIDDDGLMPKELSPEEIEKIKGELTESTKNVRAKAQAFVEIEDMMPMFKGKLTIHIKEIKTRRGTGKTTTTGNNDGPKRPRFSKIEINGVTEDAAGNTVYGKSPSGDPKYTFSFAAQYLKRQHKGIKWGVSDLQDAYFSKGDPDNMPNVVEFVMPYTYKDDNGNEQTVNYTIKCYK